ncbi:hypothetical protein MIND_01121100 [Mycena indigotica]|uniref:Uncharacterized protein n=1 Tax=Mycena indigotica TaxID=2126181 RepID=A0A8H6S6T3_9AGAR|nr:uncharacterized protein MIND_01121100 [Mycena indigotica]KAF7293437.1 hypothetical protein MIND_01121100 [Mycena indigotica]
MTYRASPHIALSPAAVVKQLHDLIPEFANALLLPHHVTRFVAIFCQSKHIPRLLDVFVSYWNYIWSTKQCLSHFVVPRALKPWIHFPPNPLPFSTQTTASPTTINTHPPWQFTLGPFNGSLLDLFLDIFTLSKFYVMFLLLNVEEGWRQAFTLPLLADICAARLDCRCRGKRPSNPYRLLTSLCISRLHQRLSQKIVYNNKSHDFVPPPFHDLVLDVVPPFLLISVLSTFFCSASWIGHRAIQDAHILQDEHLHAHEPVPFRLPTATCRPNPNSPLHHFRAQTNDFPDIRSPSSSTRACRRTTPLAKFDSLDALPPHLLDISPYPAVFLSPNLCSLIFRVIDVWNNCVSSKNHRRYLTSSMIAPIQALGPPPFRATSDGPVPNLLPGQATSAVFTRSRQFLHNLRVFYGELKRYGVEGDGVCMLMWLQYIMSSGGGGFWMSVFVWMPDQT